MVKKLATNQVRLVRFILVRLDIDKSFLHVFGKKSGLEQSWDMSQNDGHMLYQVGPLQKAEKIHQIRT